MPKVYLTNSFSVNMLPDEKTWVLFMPLDKDAFVARLKEKEFESYIGHEGTAKLLSILLGKEVEVNRGNLKLQDGDEVYIVVVSERLPEGKVLDENEVKSLLNAGKVKFWLATVFDVHRPNA